MCEPRVRSENSSGDVHEFHTVSESIAHSKFERSAGSVRLSEPVNVKVAIVLSVPLAGPERIAVPGRIASDPELDRPLVHCRLDLDDPLRVRRADRHLVLPALGDPRGPGRRRRQLPPQGTKSEPSSEHSYVSPAGRTEREDVRSGRRAAVRKPVTGSTRPSGPDRIVVIGAAAMCRCAWLRR